MQQGVQTDTICNIQQCCVRLQGGLFTMGRLSNDDGDGNGNENVNKAVGLDEQNNNFARASRFFAVTARVRRRSD